MAAGAEGHLSYSDCRSSLDLVRCLQQPKQCWGTWLRELSHCHSNSNLWALSSRSLGTVMHVCHLGIWGRLSGLASLVYAAVNNKREGQKLRNDIWGWPLTSTPMLWHGSSTLTLMFTHAWIHTHPYILYIPYTHMSTDTKFRLKTDWIKISGHAHEQNIEFWAPVWFLAPKRWWHVSEYTL